MDVDALSKLKKKVSEEFYKLIFQVRKGYKPDHEYILEEISFIELIQNNETYRQIALSQLSEEELNLKQDNKQEGGE